MTDMTSSSAGERAAPAGASAGRIVALHIAPARRAPMQPLAEAEVRANWGVVGDHHARPDSSRQVLLVEAETLERLGLAPGAVRENITVRGVDLMSLGRGSLLRLGDEVELEITKYCTPCQRLEETRPGLMREITGQRGMLAHVVRGGRLRPGDPVTIVKAVPPQHPRLPG
ncbi:MAG TPA: MOSC domain-containing protein [Limnochordales bacterium]